MKRFYFVSVIFILIVCVTLVGYGVYLNRTSDSYIENRMSSRVIRLNGVKAYYGDLKAEVLVDFINLFSANQADAIAQMDGMLREVYVVQGQEVKRGDKLFAISNAEIPLAIARADTDIAKAEAAYLQARNTMERNRRLSLKNAISKSEMEMSETQLAAARAELDAVKIARNQLDLQKTLQIVTAPLDGVVMLTYKHEGNFISKGTPLALIADFGKMYFIDLADDDKLQNLLPIDEFSLHVNLSNMTDKAFDTSSKYSYNEKTSFDARVMQVSPPLSESALSRAVTWEIDNSVGVLEFGLYTDVIIRKKLPRKALLIPKNTLRNMKAEPSVYVQDSDSTLALRKIETGAYDGERIEVVAGLEEGEVVITSGVAGLELGIQIEVALDQENDS